VARLVYKTIEGIKLQAFSVAGEESVIVLPEHNVCFDPGRAPRETIPIDNMCLTHGHMDHAAGVAYYFSQRTFVGIAPGRVICHREIAQHIQRLMAVWADIERHPSPGVVYGVDPLEDVQIRRGLLLRPFEVNHTAGALGYTLVDVRRKLKPELSGKTGPELVALKKQGIEIENVVEVPVLTCTGDTAVGRWMDLDFVRGTGVLLVECTFFEPEHRERARAGRHIHVCDVPAIMEAAPAARVVLTHMTRRTDPRWARQTLEQLVKPADMERISFLMERDRHSSGRHARQDSARQGDSKSDRARLDGAQSPQRPDARDGDVREVCSDG